MAYAAHIIIVNVSVAYCPDQANNGGSREEVS